MTRTPLLLFAAASLLVLPSCGGIESEAKYPTGADRSLGDTNDIYAEPDSIFGTDGLSIFGGRGDDKNDGGGIGVNSYLWRASLDTVSFMPLASADPFGGVILTDWFAPANSPEERFKLNVLILGKDLRSDGVRVRAFRQVKKGSSWSDAAVPETMARELEDAILTRARQIRVAGAE